jgi:hypothetical protein
VKTGFICGLRQQGQTAWSASALRVLSAFGADAAGVLWGLVGRLYRSAEVLGGFWVGAEKCGRWEAV